MILNVPDGMAEAATAAWLGLQAWQIQKLFSLDKKVSIINTKLDEHSAHPKQKEK